MGKLIAVIVLACLALWAVQGLISSIDSAITAPARVVKIKQESDDAHTFNSGSLRDRLAKARLDGYIQTAGLLVIVVGVSVAVSWYALSWAQKAAARPQVVQSDNGRVTAVTFRKGLSLVYANSVPFPTVILGDVVTQPRLPLKAVLAAIEGDRNAAIALALAGAASTHARVETVSRLADLFASLGQPRANALPAPTMIDVS